jgi:hypothetical protein
LPELDLVNIGAAGTFVVRRKIGVEALREALRPALPFETEIITCEGSAITALLADDPFRKLRLAPEIVRFISILGATPAHEPELPAEFGDEKPWLVKVFARRDRFLIGAYRRHMKTIRFLGKVDRLVTVPITTRNWNTMATIGKVLG